MIIYKEYITIPRLTHFITSKFYTLKENAIKPSIIRYSCKVMKKKSLS